SRDHYCCWHDSRSKPDSTLGQFVRGKEYYSESQAHFESWLRDFNKSKPADEWWQTTQHWQRMLPETELNYAARCRPTPDDELLFPKFPHLLRKDKETAPTANYYELLHYSPFGGDLLLKLVKRAVESENLGNRGVPDLLCVSFSSN